jgi:hypothetical protein
MEEPVREAFSRGRPVSANRRVCLTLALVAAAAAMPAGAASASAFSASSWRLHLTGGLKRVERGRSSGGAEKQESSPELVLYFGRDGLWRLTDLDGTALARGPWKPRGAAARTYGTFGLELEPSAIGGGPGIGGVAFSPPGGSVEFRSWKLSAALRRAKDGSDELRVRWRFSFAVSDSGGVALYSLSVAGVGERAGSGGGPNHPPVARVQVLPPSGELPLDDGRAVGVLDASGSDDGDDGEQALYFLWTKLSGPSGDSIRRPMLPTTEVVFTRPGIYLYQLTLSDGSRSNGVVMETVSIDVFEPDRGATLDWDPPVSNADGSPLVDLAGFWVYFGECDPGFENCPDLADQRPPFRLDARRATHYVVEGLAPGRTYYFFVTAYDRSGNESAASEAGFKTIVR